MATSGSVQPSLITTSQKKYATGRRAKAQCPICSDVILYKNLVLDWRGVWVCADCRDPKHPQENVQVYADPEALEHAQPLRDTEDGAGIVRAGPPIRATGVVRNPTVVVT